MSLHLAKAVQILTEGRALSSISLHIVNASASDAQCHGSQGNTFDFEIPHHAKCCSVDLSNYILLRDQYIIEHQLCRHTGSHAELIFNLLPKIESLHAPFDNKLCNITSSLTGPSIHQKHITSILPGQRTVGNPHFCSIQDVSTSILVQLGSRLHTQYIGAGGRFTHTHATNLGALTRPRQEFFQLLSRTIDSEVVDEQYGMGQI
mmetsp:Transcript_34766/g.75393  ORF Transcript_34766/g.75393 Transcript_34766/m.75393 type:complete len:205 (-) Transcript_34766:377-991(-)